jgi:hypothetical protein
MVSRLLKNAMFSLWLFNTRIKWCGASWCSVKFKGLGGPSQCLLASTTVLTVAWKDKETTKIPFRLVSDWHEAW